jgi:hypothetical protein
MAEALAWPATEDSSSSPTVRRARLGPSPRAGSSSRSGRRSTPSARRDRSRWRWSSVARGCRFGSGSRRPGQLNFDFLLVRAGFELDLRTYLVCRLQRDPLASQVDVNRRACPQGLGEDGQPRRRLLPAHRPLSLQLARLGHNHSFPNRAAGSDPPPVPGADQRPNATSTSEVLARRGMPVKRRRWRAANAAKHQNRPPAKVRFPVSVAECASPPAFGPARSS